MKKLKEGLISQQYILEDLKRDIIRDYSQWLEIAISKEEDKLGLSDLILDNFIGKINRFMLKCQENSLNL